MLRVILMDFNGVILNDEPLHLELYRRILTEQGISLTKEEYYKKYLVLDDEDCFRQILEDQGKPAPDLLIKQMARKKARLYQKEIPNRMAFFPGVTSFIPKAASRYGMGIVSGALREEIKKILLHLHLLRYFAVIVSAQDVQKGKPDPEGLHKALEQLSLWLYKNTRGFVAIQPWECLVIEDSIDGIEMAHRAGMKCLAVANTYPVEVLKTADLVKTSLSGVTFKELEALF